MTGDDVADRAMVTTSSATETTFSLSGVTPLVIDTVDVTKVKFHANAGDDFFSNDTSIPSYVFGGDGNDVIWGGDGDDTIQGGNDNDEIHGGGGIDRILGNSGSDVLYGDAGADSLYGGSQDDTIFGGEGNDLAYGHAGDDTIRGDQGDDTLIGSQGFDRLEGNIGNDQLYGRDQSDTLLGGQGNDRLYGNNGNDFADGGGGDDAIYGHDGNDTLMGGNDEDEIYGGLGNDQIHGNTGDDSLIGNKGDDSIYGGNDNDLVYAGLGIDTVNGGSGNDRIYGQNDADILFGGGDDDLINAGSGDDKLYGGAGNDRLSGGDGNDELYGESGEDVLAGQGGNDGLIGGVGANDEMYGGDGKDRFLFAGGDIASDATTEDARIEFRNGNHSWTNREIEVIDNGLKLLHDRTLNTQLLKATMTEEPLVFIKQFTITPSDRIAENALVTVTRQVRDPATGKIIPISVLERQMTFGDWDETDLAANEHYSAEIPREIAYNWAGPDAVKNILPSQGSYWGSFLLLSGWTTDRPIDIDFYGLSQDNNWWYLKTSQFATDYSTLNPDADFSTAWRLYFETDSSVEQSRLRNKMNKVDDLFSELEVF